jgi:hypothetical protein
MVEESRCSGFLRLSAEWARDDDDGRLFTAGSVGVPNRRADYLEGGRAGYPAGFVLNERSVGVLDADAADGTPDASRGQGVMVLYAC